MPTGQLVNLPAGAPLRPTGQPFNRSTNRSVICHPFSPCPASGGRWQPQVAGGGCSALCHRFSPLSSVIDPVIHFGWQVAAPGGRWRRFSIQPSTQSSTQSSIQPSVIDSPLPRFRWQVAAPGGGWRRFSALRHRFSHLSSTQSSISGGRWQPQVAGGGLFHSALHSVLNAALHSVLRDRFSHLSSIQSSTQ